jgi:lipoprotein-releasing system permease protein
MHLVWWAPLLGVGYVVGALLVNLLAWWGMLRLLDAVGRRVAPNLFIAVRQLAGPKSGFLSVIGLLSILGVSFSSCSLDTVLSVMGGFQEDLKNKIVGANAHVIVDTELDEGIRDYRAVVDAAAAVPGVVGATPMVVGEALVQSSRTQNLAGVIVRGIDARTVGAATDLPRTLRDGARVEDLEDPFRGRLDVPADATGPPVKPSAEATAMPSADPAASVVAAAGLDPDWLAPRPRVRRGIFVGAQLAETMTLLVGDEINLIAPMGDLGPTGPMPKSRPFVVAGIFHSGMYEYDTKHVYVPIVEAQRFFGVEDVASQVVIRVDDLDRAGAVAGELRARLPAHLRVLDWQSINKGLFAALKLEKVMMFVMLSLAILVASFSIISTLTLMVFEKHREIAVLKALGTRDGEVHRIFVLQGAVIGLVGAVTGSILALTLCLLAKYVVPFPVPKEVFYLSRLPVSLSVFDFLLVGLAAVAVSVLSTIYPARIAAKLRPADGLRNE